MKTTSHKLACGHTEIGTPCKIPHGRATGLFCHSCNAFIEALPEPAPKSYQQIAGDGTTDRALGGDTAPASPVHTPEPWTIGGHPKDNSGIDWREILAPSDFWPMYVGQSLKEDAARICACVNACQGMHDPAAEIKALRDALENFCRQVEFTKYDFPPEILPEYKGSAIHVALEAARAALKGATK